MTPQDFVRSITPNEKQPERKVLAWGQAWGLGHPFLRPAVLPSLDFLTLMGTGSN